MSADVLETAAIRVARALGDRTRFRMLRAVCERERSCQELTALFPVSQATVSHHLKVLAGAGLVSARREGPFHLYSSVPEALAAHGRTLAAAFGGRPGVRRNVRGASR
jgi:ArsR family transcriptional regulator